MKKICEECLEKLGLKKSSMILFYETCDECGKKITDCYIMDSVAQHGRAQG